jgi:hypothetical protein
MTRDPNLSEVEEALLGSVQTNLAYPVFTHTPKM